MKTSLPCQFLAVVFSIVCYMPPLYLFTDAHLLPKWYLCIGGLTVMGMLAAVALLRDKQGCSYRLTLPLFCKVFTTATTLECLWVFVCIVRDGLRQGGEVGTLGNPAELALHLSIAIPIVLMLASHCKGRKWQLLYGSASVLFAFVLWLTQSRTGLICLALYVVVYVCVIIHRKVGKKMIRRGMYVVLMIAVSVCMYAYVSSHKTASSSGRAFILQRSWTLVKEHPFMGHGHRGFEREYMLRQADYFKENSGSEYAQLADEIRHPLCEFVYVWVNYGVLAPVALLTVLLLPFWRWKRGDKKMRPFLLPMLAILVFSCFSYPFYYPIAWLTVGASALYAARRVLSHWQKHPLSPYILLVISFVVLGITIIDAVQEHRWYQAYRHSFREDTALKEYEDLHPYFHRNHVFLYSYAMASFKRKNLDKAKQMIAECGQYWSGYNRELLAGDICYYRKEYPAAITHYQMAHNMCPVRFAPLEGLYKVYGITGDALLQQEVAGHIATKHVKVNSLDVVRIKRECK